MSGTIEQLIGSLGFPIAVTVYLLYERRTALRELTGAINDLRDMIGKVCAKLE